MRALAETTGDTYPAALSAAAQVPEMPTGQALQTWAVHGLLSFDTRPTYNMRTTYRVTRPIPPQVGRGNYRTATEIAEYLNRLLDASPGELIIPREQIETHLRSAPRWAEVAGLRDIIQGILKKFVAKGYLEAVTSHYGLTHARVSLTPEQRQFFATIVGEISSIAAGDSDAIATWRRAGERIVANPETVRHLIRRGFAASKLAQSPMSEGERLRLAAEAAAKAPGGTTEQILAVADPRFSVHQLRAELSKLAKHGELVAKKQPDGPYRRWHQPAAADEVLPRTSGRGRRTNRVH